MKDYISFRDPSNIIPPISEVNPEFIVAVTDNNMVRLIKQHTHLSNELTGETINWDEYNWFGAHSYLAERPREWGWETTESKLSILIKSYGYWSAHNTEVTMFIVNSLDGLKSIFVMYQVSNILLIEDFCNAFEKFQRGDKQC